jgi:hypothetical protein
MLIGGKEKLARMRDGRAIYIGAERPTRSCAGSSSIFRRRFSRASSKRRRRSALFRRGDREVVAASVVGISGAAGRRLAVTA